MSTKIEWTELTWNPVTGCTKVSEGCQNCYAEKMHKRLQAMGSKKYQNIFSEVKFYVKELDRDFGKKSKMIFVNSISDIFHENLENWNITEILGVIDRNKKHTFQVLTKRSKKIKEYWYKNLSNLWLGVSVELEKYKYRIDDLKQTNAKTKFISFEPLLGDMGKLDLSGIHWVIVGGESGPGARPMHPDWVRNIRNQCQEQGVPFFFKQWGAWKQTERDYVYFWNELDGGNGKSYLPGTKIEVMNGFGFEWDWGVQFCCKVPYDNQTRKVSVAKVGKKKAGRELDGKIWDEYPEERLNK